MNDLCISLISKPSKKKNLASHVHLGSAFWNVTFFFCMMRHTLKNLHGVILANAA
jgi:hypothetical protein